MIRLLLLLLLLLAALPARAEEVVAGLSHQRIALTANFDGSEIMVYGAVKRDQPAPEGPLEVIVTVEGPSTPVTVRRKSRVFGIWVNTESVVISRAPSFYAIATTAPFSEILSDTENLRHQISIPRAIRAVGIAAAEDAPGFTEALVRIRQAEGHYHLDENTVGLAEATLFRADFVLPANLVEGDYRVRIFLTRGGAVVDLLEETILVRKEGLERFLYNLAQDQPLVYGTLALALAVVAALMASAAFRFFRL
ncbi:MAG: TIGR02186 family protein [Gemmobacter sp.]